MFLARKPKQGKNDRQHSWAATGQQQEAIDDDSSHDDGGVEQASTARKLMGSYGQDMVNKDRCRQH